ncbi:MAG: universal stress protein [Thermosynechococcaceae cyanobacterium]
MKRILLCTDGSGFAQSSYYYGAWFARRLGAAIEVLHGTDARSQDPSMAANLSGSIGIDASDNLLQKLVDLEHQKAKLSHQQSKLILQAAATALQELGVTAIQTTQKNGVLVDLVQEMETTMDLVILGKRGESADSASGHLGTNLERIIRASHKPILVTSRQIQPIERLLLADDGSPSSQKMLTFLLESPVFQGLELHIVTVAKNIADQTAIARIDQAKQQAQTRGFEPICRLIEGYPEVAISQYTEEASINLLMMGAYGHSRIRHLVVGSTTAQILRSSNIPVLVFR